MRACKVLLGLLGVALLFSTPIRSQETQEPSASPETVRATYPDTADGLRRLLVSTLAKGAPHSVPSGVRLILSTDVPVGAGRTRKICNNQMADQNQSTCIHQLQIARVARLLKGAAAASPGSKEDQQHRP